LANVVGFGVGAEVKRAKSELKVSEVESLQLAVAGQEQLMGQPWHAQQAFAAELLPPVI
jgi:hypothetical protein